jgi:hypothetical protein
MEQRVTRLEEDMQGVKAVLSRLEPMIIRIDATLAATLPHLATKADVADLRTEMNDKFAAMDQKFERKFAAMDQKFAAMDQKFDERFADVDKRFAQVDVKFALVDVKFAVLEAKIAELPTRTYMWAVLGVLITAYGAGLAALAIIK